MIRHTNLGGTHVEWHYVFVIQNINELEWLMTTSNDRPFVARGTLSRVH